ncbi:MAG: glycoside hydrolase [Flavobacteriaceae bacterium]|nr:glycoside hydrolase [Flavobacteriaceae bacterium]
MSLKRVVLILILSISFLNSCAQKEIHINGVSFVASPDSLNQSHIDPIIKLNANYAAIMPFGFVESLQHPEIAYNSDRQWFGETKEGVKQYVEKLHLNNIRVMLKPQIWIWHGEYTGNLQMTSEEDWQVLENSYRDFILDFAMVAEENKVDIFCLATELEQFITHRPDYWNELISEIKTIYKGKLTYAANWDEYKRVPFWKQLDFIGIDAYFPISESKTPTIEEAKLGWKPWKEEMISVSTKANKKILFTEYGYRSVNYSGKEPWKSDRNMGEVNLKAQENLTKALFEEIWKEEWFVGGFLWKWHIKHNGIGGKENTMFTPQNKPVEAVIKGNYQNK